VANVNCGHGPGTSWLDLSVRTLLHETGRGSQIEARGATGGMLAQDSTNSTIVRSRSPSQLFLISVYLTTATSLTRARAILGTVTVLPVRSTT
jgi:hypothetical protein